MNPVNLNYFAVGGSDQYARVYDIRRVNTNGPKMEEQLVECYAPKHLQEPGISFSQLAAAVSLSRKFVHYMSFPKR